MQMSSGIQSMFQEHVNRLQRSRNYITKLMLSYLGVIMNVSNVRALNDYVLFSGNNTSP